MLVLTAKITHDMMMAAEESALSSVHSTNSLSEGSKGMSGVYSIP